MVDECDASPGRAGKVAPVIDRNLCEGKAECVRVCPFGVFRIEVLSGPQRSALRWRGRLKAWAHGGRQAMVVNAGDCHACRLCVAACPEEAITLAPLAVPKTNG
jgi:NAD-dependent dihydropyrimidine dehydrogenase PreA subunit